MADLCFLLVFKDTLFRKTILSLLGEMDSKIRFFESNAEHVNELLNEISKFRPDTVLLEETSPLSADSCLVHLLKEMPDRRIVVVSQEHNRIHVLHWQTFQVEKADDLIECIKSDQ